MVQGLRHPTGIWWAFFHALLVAVASPEPIEGESLLPGEVETRGLLRGGGDEVIICQVR